MDGEPTSTTDTPGKEADKNIESDTKPISIYDKTEAIVKRQEEANKKTEELLGRQETLYANQRLAGTAGGNVPVVAKEETPKEYNDRIDKEIEAGQHDG